MVRLQTLALTRFSGMMGITNQDEGRDATLTEDRRAPSLVAYEGWNRPKLAPALRMYVERAGTLSLNRITWRGLLGMEDTRPGTDQHRVLHHAANRDSLETIAATAEPVTEAQRLSLAAGFMRFIHELVQEVFETLVSGHVPDVTDLESQDDYDNIMMVQLSLAMVQRCRNQFGSLQDALERQVAKSKMVLASHLLRYVESRYR